MVEIQKSREPATENKPAGIQVINKVPADYMPPKFTVDTQGQKIEIEAIPCSVEYRQMNVDSEFEIPSQRPGIRFKPHKLAGVAPADIVFVTADDERIPRRGLLTFKTELEYARSSLEFLCLAINPHAMENGYMPKVYAAPEYPHDKLKTQPPENILYDSTYVYSIEHGPAYFIEHSGKMVDRVQTESGTTGRLDELNMLLEPMPESLPADRKMRGRTNAVHRHESRVGERR